jgi:hypothetical protein
LDFGSGQKRLKATIYLSASFFALVIACTESSGKPQLPTSKIENPKSYLRDLS